MGSSVRSGEKAAWKIPSEWCRLLSVMVTNPGLGIIASAELTPTSIDAHVQVVPSWKIEWPSTYPSGSGRGESYEMNLTWHHQLWCKRHLLPCGMLSLLNDLPCPSSGTSFTHHLFPLLYFSCPLSSGIFFLNLWIKLSFPLPCLTSSSFSLLRCHNGDSVNYLAEPWWGGINR